MTFDNLLLTHDGPVATLTVNRPKVLNALNRQTVEELGRAALALAADDSVRVVILTGAGEKAFVAGADIAELAVQTPVSARETALLGQRVLDAVEQMGKPVIAAINGYALGGGCELAMACTLRIAAETARLGPARDQPGIDSRLCRQSASAAPRRPRPCARTPPYRRSGQRLRGPSHRAGQSGRSGGRADERGARVGSHARDEGADRGPLYPRRGPTRPRYGPWRTDRRWRRCSSGWSRARKTCARGPGRFSTSAAWNSGDAESCALNRHRRRSAMLQACDWRLWSRASTST